MSHGNNYHATYYHRHNCAVRNEAEYKPKTMEICTVGGPAAIVVVHACLIGDEDNLYIPQLFSISAFAGVVRLTQIAQ